MILFYEYIFWDTLCAFVCLRLRECDNDAPIFGSSQFCRLRHFSTSFMEDRRTITRFPSHHWLEHHNHNFVLTFTTIILGINSLCCPIYSCWLNNHKKKRGVFHVFLHSDQRRYAWVHLHHWLKYSNHLLHNWVSQNRHTTNPEVKKIFMNFLIGKYESAEKFNQG